VNDSQVQYFFQTLHCTSQEFVWTVIKIKTVLNSQWTVGEFDSQLTRDIKELVDREADLLNRGRPIKSMEKLRTRLQSLFLQFLQNPEYNPRAKDFIAFSGSDEEKH